VDLQLEAINQMLKEKVLTLMSKAQMVINTFKLNFIQLKKEYQTEQQQIMDKMPC
jgi:hypothetical protein